MPIEIPPKVFDAIAAARARFSLDRDNPMELFPFGGWGQGWACTQGDGVTNAVGRLRL
jgi:hypothetical protein